MNEMSKTVEEVKKYKTEEVTMKDGSKLLRIIALRDIETTRGVIIRGEPGGLIAHEECLSQYGDCWVEYNAKVLDDARVRDDAQIFGNAMVADNATIYDQVEISGNAVVMNKAHVSGRASIYDNARVCGTSHVGGYAKVYGNAVVGNDASVSMHATIRGFAKVLGISKVLGHAIVEGTSAICGDAEISENAIITANGGKYNKIQTGRFGINAYIDGKAIDFVVAGPFGSRDDMTTVYYTKNGLYVYCGCFNDPIEDFAHAVELTHGRDKIHSYYRDYNEFISFAMSILHRHHVEGHVDEITDIKDESLMPIITARQCATEEASSEPCNGVDSEAR